MEDYVLYNMPKVAMLFREEDADNRHNRRRREALKRKQNKMNKQFRSSNSHSE